MSLETLSLKEHLSLARRAARIAILRFQRIAEKVEPADRSLLALLREMLAEERRHAEALDLYDGRTPVPPAWRLDKPRVDAFLRQSFPSVSRGLGEGTLDRDFALYYAETLEEETSRFYRKLAGDAPDEESRGFFLNLSESEECHLGHLRTVLL